MLALVPLAVQVRADRPDTNRTPRANGVSPPPAYDWRRVLRGKLSNGLRYAILPRHGSEPGVGLLMRVEGGFMAERRLTERQPGERGLVHFIEHVGFDSPVRGAPDDPGRGRRIGGPLTLPAPTAGATDHGHSSYFLSSRRTDPADLDTLLMLFRERASELVFRDEVVAPQRADVMREMAEKRAGNVQYAAYIAAVAPGSPDDLIDAQNSDDVPTASVGTIRALYHRLYRPERTTLVLVGNVDPAAMVALIRRHFGDWQGVGPSPPPLPVPTFSPDRIAPISHAANSGRTGVLISATLASPRSVRTRTRMRSQVMDLVAVAALDARLRRDQPDSPPGKVGAVIENGDGYRLIRLLDHVAPDRWQASLAMLSRTLCSVTGSGLSDGEWEMAKRQALADLDRRTAVMALAKNVDLAAELGRAVVTGEEPVAPDALARAARARLPRWSTSAANRWLAGQWRAGVPHVRVETPDLARLNDPHAAIATVMSDSVQGSAGCRIMTGGTRRFRAG